MKWKSRKSQNHQISARFHHQVRIVNFHQWTGSRHLLHARYCFLGKHRIKLTPGERPSGAYSSKSVLSTELIGGARGRLSAVQKCILVCPIQHPFSLLLFSVCFNLSNTDQDIENAFPYTTQVTELPPAAKIMWPNRKPALSHGNISINSNVLNNAAKRVRCYKRREEGGKQIVERRERQWCVTPLPLTTAVRQHEIRGSAVMPNPFCGSQRSLGLLEACIV